jgi:hypothetical protein
MPQKAGVKLEKVISSKISIEKFEQLESYARVFYIQNKIKQPTVSRLVRRIVYGWLKHQEDLNAQQGSQGS